MFRVYKQVHSEVPAPLGPKTRSSLTLLRRFLAAINQDVSSPGSFNVTDSHTYCKNLDGGVPINDHASLFKHPC